ncbi:C-type lectin domain family 4 member G-like [Girardinichthys multiradiatus]|uniref:C-type lectin domain family 4 member G-like n=1 Tax=Girardinichthys multiradiatus TaxID=208333 RepID=UPI001FAB4EC9|nr:C-type lectin domain family 4 member G-like [Girardinichthys multiradiatus]
MAEENVNYAAVVFKNKKQPQSKSQKEEETVYDEVKVRNETAQQTSDSKAKAVEDAVYVNVQKRNERVQQTPDKSGFLSDKAAERCRRYQLLASCFGTLCVILVLSIIGVCVYFATVHESAARELNQVKSQQKVLLEENHNLTNLNNKLSSDYQNLTVQFNNLTAVSTALNNKTTTLTAENHNLTNLNNKLSSDYQNLTVQFNNLTAVSTALNNKTTTLTEENHNLTSLNEGLRKERENLTELIKNMEKTWNELNVSQAQWSIDAYCPKKAGVRNCTSCQDGWLLLSPSCYAYNNAAPSNQRNWESARDVCRTMNSDLTVVSNQPEKNYVNTISPADKDIKGYWIGLRVEEGKWKWIDGSDLTNQAWMQQQSATDGQCVTSLQKQEWKSVRCNERNAWICQKKALSV